MELLSNQRNLLSILIFNSASFTKNYFLKIIFEVRIPRKIILKIYNGYFNARNILKSQINKIQYIQLKQFLVGSYFSVAPIFINPGVNNFFYKKLIPAFKRSFSYESTKPTIYNITQCVDCIQIHIVCTTCRYYHFHRPVLYRL